MLGRRQPIFFTSYFQFEKIFDFIIYDEYVQMIACVCLPGIRKNNVNYRGKVVEFYYQIFVRTLCVYMTESGEDNDGDKKAPGVALHVSMITVYVCLHGNCVCLSPW